VYCGVYAEVREATAMKNTCAGAKAYEMRTAAIYRKYQKHFTNSLKEFGVPELKEIPEGKHLSDQVLIWHGKEIAKHFSGTGYQYVIFYSGFSSFIVLFRPPVYEETEPVDIEMLLLTHSLKGKGMKCTADELD
jgi:hypothetical protein